MIQSPSSPSQTAQLEIVAVVAMDRRGVIGKGLELPWRLSSDLRRFKQLTMGHTLLMGRKTYDSIGRPLPGRKTIVLSRQVLEGKEDLCYVADWDQAIAAAPRDRKLFVVGGAEVYRLALPWCQSAWVTKVLADVDGDIRLPAWPWRYRVEYFEYVPQGPRDEWATEVELRKRVGF